MDQYQRITQATIGSTGSTWSYDSGTNLLSGISATGVQGYSYSFDGNTGNLGSRTNTILSKSDYFGYDTENLDRLTSMTPTVNLAPTSITYTTNKNGNIQSKSDAGTYEYNNTPYAVSRITSGQNISNDLQEIQYYSFEKVKKITEGTTTIKTADFDYNADRQRIRMVLKTNGTATKTRYYFGGSCEREVVGSITTQYIWIGGDAYTAVAVAQKVGTGAWTVYNIFRDHLGTITHLKTGSTVTEYSFDAWGRRRDKDDWTYTLTSEPALFANRGFTAHEYLEDFKLYNMNGRLYDPVVGRFLSPDPYVQDPGFTQNLNRYSYCLNNPLKFTDPSGEFWNLLFVWGGNYVINWLNNTINDKMSPKQAFQQTPIMVSGNYSPSANKFTHPQIDAQAIVKNQERVWKNLKELEAGINRLPYLVTINGDRWTSDPITNLRIKQLDQRLQTPAKDFINFSEAIGVSLRITQGYRSNSEQDVLYAQGRTTPGLRVTNAKGGESYHNYGLAFDVVLMSKGQPVWTPIPSYIGYLGGTFGFEWGGNWTSFYDYPHFQMTFGQRIFDLQKK